MALGCLFNLLGLSSISRLKKLLSLLSGSLSRLQLTLETLDFLAKLSLQKCAFDLELVHFPLQRLHLLLQSYSCLFKFTLHLLYLREVLISKLIELPGCLILGGCFILHT